MPITFQFPAVYDELLYLKDCPHYSIVFGRLSLLFDDYFLVIAMISL